MSYTKPSFMPDNNVRWEYRTIMSKRIDGVMCPMNVWRARILEDVLYFSADISETETDLKAILCDGTEVFLGYIWSTRAEVVNETYPEKEPLDPSYVCNPYRGIIERDWNGKYLPAPPDEFLIDL
jgi:hypothetical protein